MDSDRANDTPPDDPDVTSELADSFTGLTISHYRILERLGSGGMGVVYKAEDLRLGRFVAVKFLPPDIAHDPKARSRFEREARAASALNHPNICTIYEVEEYNQQPVIVMELLEGRNLRQRISSGPFAIDEILDLGIDTASALEAAHAKSVIHRDIKPGNIFITKDGHAKVLDFGLAKAAAIVGAQLRDLPTAPLDDEVTATGIAMGTVSYMSPEQIRAGELDGRTDIFSLGVVLYQMVTGKLPFSGATQSIIIDAVLHRQPESIASANPELSRKLTEIINKCLQKDRSLRYQHASEVRSDLQRLKRELESASIVAERAPSISKSRLLAAWIIAAVLFITALAALLYALRRHQPAEAALRMRPLTNYPGGQYEPAFSPDGSQIAFVWNGGKENNFDIYVKLVDGGTPLRITTNPASEGSPAWSPDGHRIAFLRYSTNPGESGFYVVPAIGGPEKKIADAAPLAHIFDRHLDWSPDGLQIAVVDKINEAGPFGIFALSVETGERRLITSPLPRSVGDTGPAFSPDGRNIAFLRSIDASVNDIYVVPVTGGEPKRLTFDNGHIANHAWSPDGRELIFSSSRGGGKSIWRVPVSGGAPKQIATVGQGAYYIAVSRKGHYLAFSRWFADTNIWRLSIGSGAKNAVPEELISSTWEERSPQYSPDGSRIAFRSDRSGNNEIWVCDSSGANPLQLTSFGGPLTGTPRWSPDGKILAFDSRLEGRSAIYTVSSQGGAPHRITAVDFDGAVPSWSRDGRWIYFASSRNNGLQVWKIPVKNGPKDGDPVQVTQHGGFAAFESLDGQWLFYAKGYDVAGLWKIPASGGEETPVIPNMNAGYWGYWAVAPHGIYFLAPKPPGRAAVNVYDFKTGSTAEVAVLLQEPPFGDSGFAVSPGENWILYTQVDHSGSDIMLVEGFR